MTSPAEQYVDEFGNVHVRGTELGHGGQGVVFRTRDADVAIKLLARDGVPVSNQRCCDEYRENLRRVRLLPLPPRLQLAGPVAGLRDVAGYVMRLLSDMQPFSHFFPGSDYLRKISEADVPGWLKGVSPDLAGRLMYYRHTGGLLRRLEGLYKCAVLLSRIHGAGLVYGDVSPANVYIAKSDDLNDVWLIDADNLRFETPAARGGMYTPKFGAPELVQGLDGARPRTDCHAFAVLAFHLLSMVHPFIGDHVQEGGDADWADDNAEEQNLDAQALAGLLPWVDDEDDNLNRTDDGLPRELVLSDGLRRLFQETFGPGRTMPWRRPSIFHWPEALARALDIAVRCPNCAMGSYCAPVAQEFTCPYCGTELASLLKIDAFEWLGRGVEMRGPCWSLRESLVSQGTETIRERLVAPFSVAGGNRPVLELAFSGENVSITRTDVRDDLRISIASPSIAPGKFIPVCSRIKITAESLADGVYLFVDGSSPRLLHVMTGGQHQ